MFTLLYLQNMLILHNNVFLMIPIELSVGHFAENFWETSGKS
jgi:hypothetical protein